MQVHSHERLRGPRDAVTTRDALVQAASELFARYGFGGTTVDQIARKARANKAMINYHFGGKEGLYEQILISTFSEAGTRMQALLDTGLPAGELVGRFAAMFAAMIAERPHFPGMVLREALSGGRHMTERVLQEFVGVFFRVREIFERGVREGTFRPVDPTLCHLVFMGSLVFFFATEPMRRRLIEEGKLPLGDAPDTGCFVDTLRELMTRGLAAGLRPSADLGRAGA